jgi:glycosyltransferase involved in cell wall biosynthesis
VPDTPEISVIVPTFNRAESLRETLMALADQTLEASRYEVIVVDDGSVDGTGNTVARFAAEHPSLSLRYERHSANRFRSAACNTGIRAARGELVVFADDDIRPVPGWLQAHLERHLMEGREVSVTGKVLYPLQWERKSNWVRFANDNYRQNETIKRLDSGSLPPNRHAGGNTSSPRETLIRVGLFDENVLRGEDTELACRLYQAGVPLLYEPKAMVYHYAEAIQSIQATLRTFRRAYEFDGPYLKNKHPWFNEKFGHWFLDPPDPVHDSVRRRLVKTAVQLVGRRSTERAAIRMLRLTDGVPWLYCRLLHQYVLVCEALDAIRASETARPCNGAPMASGSEASGRVAA